MKYFFYLCGLLLALGGLALPFTGCRPAKPTAAAADTVALAMRGDSAAPGEVVRKRVFGRDSAAKQSHAAPGLISRIFNLSNGTTKQKPNLANQPRNAPKKCKNCTFYTVAGPATITNAAKKATVLGEGATNIDKAKAPVAVGAGAGATDNTKAGQRGGAAAVGAGSTATATTQKKTLLATLLPWLGVAGAGAAAYFLGWPWLLALFRRKKSTDNQA